MAEDRTLSNSNERGLSVPDTSSRSSTTPISAASSSGGDGFLGVVAKWGQDEGDSRNGGNTTGVRTSRMIGNKLGVSPPPPPGPPPTAPPPLPPTSSISTTTHPYANPTGGSMSRRSVQPPLLSRPLPPPINTASYSSRQSNSPPMAPPTTELPALPSSVTGHRRNISSSSRSSVHSQTNGRSSSPPHVSPRTSSLYSRSQRVEMTSSPVAGPSTGFQSPEPNTTRPKPPRTPSRHLLQTALDLAQRAVEMDKRNDVLGALAAYREAVARLRNVMERVGVDPTDGKRRKSTGRTEEEGRTLRGIHDAYVARIELLSSYEDEQNGQLEDGVEDQLEQPFPPAHASASTATLVPTQKSPRTDQSEGASTPRPSMDDTATGIGNLMLNDPGDMSTDTASLSSPTRSFNRQSYEEGSLASPFLTRPQRTSSLHHLQEADIPYQPQPGSPIQPPPRRTSMGAGLHSSPQNAPGPGSPVTSSSRSTSMTSDLVSPHGGSSAGSHRRRVTSRTAMGLDSELDVPMEETEEGMEVLSRTPQRTAMTIDDTEIAHHPLAHAQLSLHRGSDSYSEEKDRPLPPLPNSAPLLDWHGRPLSLQQQPSNGRRNTGGFLVSPNVNQGTISQRRTSRNIDGVPMAVPTSSQPIEGLPGQSYDPNTSTAPSAFGQRTRTRSQPGSVRGSVDEVPPLPTSSSIRHRTSFGSRPSARVSSSGSNSSQPSYLGLRINTEAASGLIPPATTASSRSSNRSTLPRSPSGTLISPVPEPQPTELILRSFHILRVICLSMDPESSGAYLTSHIHISPAVWQAGVFNKAGQKSSGPPKIVAQEVKIRVLQTMCFHLDIIKTAAAPLLDGKRDYKHGQSAPQIDGTALHSTIGVADELCAMLDAMDEDMVNGYKMLTKHGVQVQPWKEKSKRQSNALSWSNKLKDKMTNGKVLDSPEKYVDLLSQFSFIAQVLNDHLLNFTGNCSAGYAVLPNTLYRNLESRVYNAAQFLGSALVPFILDDTMQFLSRYLKQGVKYLEE